MGENANFKAIKIGKAGNPTYFGSKSLLQIYAALSNFSASDKPYNQNDYSIDHQESLIWEGIVDHTESEIIEFEKEHTSRYLRLKYINNSLAWKDGNPSRTCLSSLEVGTAIHNLKVYPMTNKNYITMENRWDETRAGCYYNGKGYTGYAANAAPSNENSNGDNIANSVLTIKIPKNKAEFGIIGDYYPSMGKATVTLDDAEIGTIGDKSLDPPVDARKLTKASRSYKSILFYKSGIDTSKSHVLKVEVTEGSITFAGLLTDQMIVNYHNDDGSYQKVIATEFSDNPFIYKPSDISPEEFVPPIPEARKQDEKKKGLSSGAIAGIVIAAVVVVGGAVTAIVLMYVKKVACFNKVGVSASESSP